MKTLATLRLRSKLATLGVGIVLFLFHVLPLSAQDNADEELGIKPFGSYEWGNVDRINLMTGNLGVTIPLVSYPQRGDVLHLDFVLNYTNTGYYTVTNCVVRVGCNTAVHGSPGTFKVLSGMEVTAGGTDYYDGSLGYATRSIHTPDGSGHLLGKVSSATYEALDGSGYQNTNVSGTASDVISPDGVRFSTTTAANSIASKVEDPNGNMITYDTTTGWNDTIGRNIPLIIPTSDYSGCSGSRPIVQAKVWAVPIPNSTTANLKFCYTDVLIQVGAINGTGCATHWSCINRNFVLLQSVVLPNSTTWTFEYSDGYGFLTKIGYPSGGSVSYASGMQDACPGSITGSRYHPVVSSRTVDVGDGVTPTAISTYAYTFGGAPAYSVSTIVTDPLGNQAVHSGSSSNGQSCSYYENSLTQFQGPKSNNILLKTVNTDYMTASSVAQQGPWPPAIAEIPIRVTSIWPNGQQNKEEFDYDSGFTWNCADPLVCSTATATYGQKIKDRNFDYSGSLLRTKSTTYQFQGNLSYLNNNLLALPSQVSVFTGAYQAGSCGANNAAACTLFAYDGAGLASSGISLQHDPTPPSGAARGNETSISRWLNGSTVSTSACSRSVSNGFLTTQQVFYDTGATSQVTDPCMNSKAFLYSSTYAGAYPTTVTNALSQSVTYAYDFNSGLVTGVTDPNLQPTNYSYDAMFRRTQVQYADGGQTTYCYTDVGGATCSQAGPPYQVVTTQAINASLSKVTTLVVDGLGRVKQTQLNSDWEGVTSVETTYDGLGRKATATNPHRVAASSTDGTTQYNYDPLGRVITITEPDGATIGSNYGAYP